MKTTFMTKLCALALGTQQALGCIRVHNDLANDPLLGDVMTVQIWEGNTEVCRQNVGKRGASAGTVWNVRCGDYEANVWANGRAGEVWNHRDNYYAVLGLRGSDTQNYKCGTLNCSDIEACLDDQNPSCAGTTCNRCDHRGWCNGI